MPENAPYTFDMLTWEDFLVGSARLQEFNPYHDSGGRFTSRGVRGVQHIEQGPKTALSALAAGRTANVDPDEVGPLLDMAAKRKDNPDLTELHVNGTMAFGDDGLGILRKDMPQLDARAPEYVADLRKRGIKVTHEQVDPQTLKPTQMGVSASKVGQLMPQFRDGSMQAKQAADPSWRSIVSNDNYILDGHHRWGAALGYSFENPSFKVDITRVDLPMSQLLGDADAFTHAAGIKKKALGEARIEEFNPNHDKGGRFARKNGGRSDALMASLKAHEDRIVGITGGEEVVVLDKDGNVVLTKRAMGDPDGAGPMAAGMSFSAREARAFEGNVLTHNHPGAGGLSTDDISTAVNDRMAEIRAVSNPLDGTSYLHSLRPGKTTWSPEHLREVAPVWDKHFKAVDTDFRTRVGMGSLSPVKASSEVWHETLRRVADEVGWDYTRTER